MYKVIGPKSNIISGLNLVNMFNDLFLSEKLSRHLSSDVPDYYKIKLVILSDITENYFDPHISCMKEKNLCLNT